MLNITLSFGFYIQLKTLSTHFKVAFIYAKIFHRKVCRKLVCEPKCPGYLPNKEIQLNSSAQKQAFRKQQKRLLSPKKKKVSNTTLFDLGSRNIKNKALFH